MFNLTTKYGNTLDLADCVLNSLEIESPFISFYNRDLQYRVSYYLEDKKLHAASPFSHNQSLRRCHS